MFASTIDDTLGCATFNPFVHVYFTLRKFVAGHAKEDDSK